MTRHEAYDEGCDPSGTVPTPATTRMQEKDADARLSWEQGWRKAREHDYDESEG